MSLLCPDHTDEAVAIGELHVVLAVCRSSFLCVASGTVRIGPAPFLGQRS